MFIKRIICTVEESQRENFSKAQTKWSAIADAPGLVAQFGGWDSKNPACACILSLWQDRKSYYHFMAEIHDEITGSNKQSDTYKSIEVDFLEADQDMSENLDLKTIIGRSIEIVKEWSVFP